MTAIPGVAVTGLIVPQDSADSYPVTDPKYQLGGWRTELLMADRDAIPAERRRRGMQVYVAETNLIYFLAAGLTNSDWTGFSSTVVAHTHPISDVVGLQAALDAKAPLASPTFTGVPAVPTAAPGTNSTQAASTAFATAADAVIVGAAPVGLNTLAKIATSLGGDTALATTMSTALGTKAPVASPVFTGVPQGPTAANGTNTTQLATCLFVLNNQIAGGGAPLNSPSFSGIPTAPTPAAGTATSQLATTLFAANLAAALVGTAPGNLDTLGEIATELGTKQPLNANLSAESGLTFAADQIGYYTGPGAKALTGFSATGRSAVGASSSQALRRIVDRGITALVDAATIVSDGAVGTVFGVTIAGNRQIAVPTGLQPGATYCWIITNDATAGRTTTLAAGFRLPAGATWSPDTAAARINVLTGIATSTGLVLVVPATGFVP